MPLFGSGTFKLHSGGMSNYIIDCTALNLLDWNTLAIMAREIVGPFSLAVGVPRGGLQFAAALNKFATPEAGRLLVDDVLTSGASMEALRCPGDIGCVVFSRCPQGQCPPWIHPLFTLNSTCLIHA